jgi:hypothetical protein
MTGRDTKAIWLTKDQNGGPLDIFCHGGETRRGRRKWREEGRKLLLSRRVWLLQYPSMGYVIECKTSI